MKLPKPVVVAIEPKERAPLDRDALRTPADLRANVCGYEFRSKLGTYTCELIAGHVDRGVRTHRATKPGFFCWEEPE